MVFPGEAFTSDATPQTWLGPEEKLFVELMHQARFDPAATALSLGIDLDILYQERPEMSFLLQQKLPALEISHKLFRAASSHSQDMLSHDYYSHQGLDGSSPQDRMFREGYDPFIVIEELGLMGFRNYVGPEQATLALFAQTFIHELQFGDLSKPVFLNPYFKHAGIGIAKGFLRLDSFSGNAYISTLDLAAEEDVLLELMLRRKINDARLAPESALSLLSDQEESIFVAQESTDRLPKRKQSPVAMSGELTSIARFLGREFLHDHGLEEYNTGFPYDPKGFGPDIFPEFAHKILVIPVDSGSTFEDLANKSFRTLLLSELEASEESEPFIFNMDFSKSGIGAFRLEYAGHEYLLVVVLMSGYEDGPKYLVGQVVFKSEHERDFLEEQSVRIYLSNIDESSLNGFSVTGPGGYYQVEVSDNTHPFNEMRLENAAGETMEKVRVFMHRGNQRVDFLLECDSVACE